MALTVQEVKEYTRSELGYPIVQVELDDSHYQQAHAKTLRTLAFNKPRIRYIPFAVASGTQVYTLADFGVGVIDVQYPPYEYQVDTEIDLFNPRLITDPMNIADYQLSLIYGESLKEVLSADFEWDFNAETGTLMISPTPTRSYTAVAVCADEVRSDDVREPWVKEWALRFALSQCKKSLGYIRRKVQRIEGTELTYELDGTELINEGKEEERELLEEMKSKQGDFVPPVVR